MSNWNLHTDEGYFSSPTTGLSLPRLMHANIYAQVFTIMELQFTLIVSNATIVGGLVRSAGLEVARLHAGEQLISFEFVHPLEDTTRLSSRMCIFENVYLNARKK